MRRWPASGRLPSVLHEPLVSDPPESNQLQNTDPWVFGERFLYSNCKQLTPRGGPSALQSLPPGSVILFGSQLEGRFCLDTVFVVAESIRYRVDEVDDLTVDDAFRVCTIESLRAYEHKSIDLRTVQFTLYLAATVDDPVDAMFSFAPAVEATADGPRFERPDYGDRRFVNQESRQAASGAKTRRPVAEVRESWQAAVYACRRRGLDLGVRIDLPKAGSPAQPDADLSRTHTAIQAAHHDQRRLGCATLCSDPRAARARSRMDVERRAHLKMIDTTTTDAPVAYAGHACSGAGS